MVSRVWNIRAFSSKNYKMVHINSKMTTTDFISKVAKVLNVRKELICITYEFPPSARSEDRVQVEIEERDENSLHHAIDVPENYSKLHVVLDVKLLPSAAELPLVDGKWVVRIKEVTAEQLKQEMSLHDDTEKCFRGYLDAKWNTKCDELMSEHSCFLLQFDKLKAGVKLVFGNDAYMYLLNPFQIICPICLEICALSSMNQVRAISQHLREKHLDNCKGGDVRKRLVAWLKNNFTAEDNLDKVARLPETLVFPAELMETFRTENQDQDPGPVLAMRTLTLETCPRSGTRQNCDI